MGEYPIYDVMRDCVASTISYYGSQINEYQNYVEGAIDMYIRLNWDGDDGTYLITIINAIDILINDLTTGYETIIREGLSTEEIERPDYERRLNLYTHMKNELYRLMEEIINEFSID